MRDFIRLAAGLGLIAAASGCGSGGTDANPAIAISITKTAMTIQQGGNDNLTASVTRSGGYDGAVTVVTEGVPTGVTGVVSNVSTSGGTTTGTVTVTVGAAVAPGTYNLTVRASGSGVSDATAALTLTVTATPAIALSLNPTTLSLDQGANGATTVTIARTNFTEAVALTLEGAPAGVTGAFAPASATGTTSALTVTVGGAVAAGVYNLTVRGAATGVVDATAPLALTVTTPSFFGLGTITPNPVTIAQGANADVTVPITRTNFAGTVNLTLEGMPTGVTGAFAPAAAAGASSTLTVTVGAAVAPGNYTLTVRGAATGQTDKTATFTLTVTAAVAGNYSLTFTPPSPVTITQGTNTNVTVNVNRTGGFAGGVTLAATGQPAGLTTGFAPNPTTTNASTLTVTVGGAVAVGNYPITVTGTATGLANQQAILTINVTAPISGGNTTLDYSACSATTKPVWLAVKDGTGGAWTAVTGTNGVFSFDLNQSKAGIATVVSDAGSYSISVNYWTKAEAQGLTLAQLCTSAAGKSVTATTQNLGATQTALLGLGGGFGTANSAQPIATLHGVADGTFDLVGYARDLLAPGAADRVFIRRDVNTAAISAGGSVGAAVDFQGAESFAPSAATMVVNGSVGGEVIMHQMFYYTGASCTAAAFYTGAPSLTAYGVPANKQRATDYHGLNIIASSGNQTAGTARTVTDYFQVFGVRTNTLPSLIPAITPVVLAGPYKRLEFQFTLPNDLTGSATVFYAETGGTGNLVVISATSGYLGGLAVDLALPDFTGVGTWQNAYAPGTGSTGTWSAAGGGFTGTPCSGGKVLASTRTGSF